MTKILPMEWKLKTFLSVNGIYTVLPSGIPCTCMYTQGKQLVTDQLVSEPSPAGNTSTFDEATGKDCVLPR